MSYPNDPVVIPLYEADDKTRCGQVSLVPDPLPFNIVHEGRPFVLKGGKTKGRGWRYVAEGGGR